MCADRRNFARYRGSAWDIDTAGLVLRQVQCGFGRYIMIEFNGWYVSYTIYCVCWHMKTNADIQ